MQTHNSPHPPITNIHRRICLLLPHKQGEHDYIVRSLNRLGYTTEVIDYRAEKDKLNSLLPKINADVVIAMPGEGIAPELIEQIQCPKLMWYGEYIHGCDAAAQERIKEVRFNAAAFDYVVWCGEDEPDAMQVMRNLDCSRVSYNFPCRFDGTKYRKLGLPKLYDVSFVGSLTPRRNRILGFLSKHFKVEYRNIWDIEEMVRFFNQSKIVLHINFDEFLTYATINQRTFDIVGSGTFMLNEDVVRHKLFTDKVHLVYWRFNDLADLRQKIEYYLAHDTEREHIAETGYQFVQNHFSVDDTFKKLLKKIDFSLLAPRLYKHGSGIALDKFGRPTGLKNEYHKAVEPLCSEKYPHHYFERGNIYFEIKLWEKAADCYEEALALNGNFIQAVFMLARCYKKLDRKKDAIRELHRVLTLSPFHAHATLELGHLYNQIGKHDKGAFYISKAEKLLPKHYDFER